MHDSDTIIFGNLTVSMSARSAGVEIGYTITVPSDMDERGSMVEEMLRLGRESMVEQVRDLDRPETQRRNLPIAQPIGTAPTKDEGCDVAGR